MRFVVALLLFASVGNAEENCGSMLRTMKLFEGRVVSAETVARTKSEFEPVDLDPNFVVVIRSVAGETFTLGIHSLARTFGSKSPVNRTFLFDAEQMECNGKFRRLLTLQVHPRTPIVETFDGTLEVGHRYRAKIYQSKEGIALTKSLDLPMHHDGGVSFINADEFPNVKDEIVFDVTALRITHEAEWEWLSMFDAKLVK
ncbi:MAG TPA: hypothetical protein VJ901_19840 [Thermoanaerobaculia bacterium]|nr:hypothetical protein [Thermoanaerobaculia bacterium]